MEYEIFEGYGRYALQAMFLGHVTRVLRNLTRELIENWMGTCLLHIYVFVYVYLRMHVLNNEQQLYTLSTFDKLFLLVTLDLTTFIYKCQS